MDECRFGSLEQSTPRLSGNNLNDLDRIFLGKGIVEHCILRRIDDGIEFARRTAVENVVDRQGLIIRTQRLPASSISTTRTTSIAYTG